MPLQPRLVDYPPDFSGAVRLPRFWAKGTTMKKGSVAFLLWLLGWLGPCGLHRFYVGRYWTGTLWLLTYGLLGVGQLFDLFFLGSMVRQANLLNGLAGYSTSNAAAISTNTVSPIFNVTVNVPEQIVPIVASTL
jgi:TM2 domain-containing membrane protein YozV